MTPTTPTFEDRLLTELRAVVATHPSPTPAAATAPRRGGARRRPRVLAGGLASVGAATAAVVLIGGGSAASPAFAVQRQADGDVTVTVSSLEDSAGLARELKAAGVPAVVDYAPAGKMCRQPRGTVATPGGVTRMGLRVVDGGAATFTITRGSVGTGETLVLSTSGGEGPTSMGMSIVEGAVAPCTLVDAPATADGPGAAAATGSSERSIVTSSKGHDDGSSPTAAP